MTKTVYLLATDCARPMLVGAFYPQDADAVIRVMAMFRRPVIIVDNVEVDEAALTVAVKPNSHKRASNFSFALPEDDISLSMSLVIGKGNRNLVF